jgi:hypothetical protein
MAMAITHDNDRNFIRFSLFIALAAAFPRLPVREVALSLAGLHEEGLIYLDDAGQGVDVGTGALLQKAMTPAEGRLQVDAQPGR